jgi:hypothetical protein
MCLIGKIVIPDVTPVMLEVYSVAVVRLKSSVYLMTSQKRWINYISVVSFIDYLLRCLVGEAVRICVG